MRRIPSSGSLRCPRPSRRSPSLSWSADGKLSSTIPVSKYIPALPHKVGVDLYDEAAQYPVKLSRLKRPIPLGTCCGTPRASVRLLREGQIKNVNSMRNPALYSGDLTMRSSPIGSPGLRADQPGCGWDYAIRPTSRTRRRSRIGAEIGGSSKSKGRSLRWACVRRHYMLPIGQNGSNIEPVHGGTCRPEIRFGRRFAGSSVPDAAGWGNPAVSGWSRPRRLRPLLQMMLTGGEMVARLFKPETVA